MATAPDILARWGELFPDAPPVGFLLREAYPERWLRIHSLPNAQRYPTSGFDYVELLRRHNAVATDLLGDTAPCAILLVHTCRGRGVRTIGIAEGLSSSGLPHLAPLPLDLSDEKSGVFAVPMCLFGMHATWRRDAFNRLICAVAEDHTRGLIVNLSSGCVYAPYDGGADLFYSTETERDAAGERFAAWTSPRDDGL